MPITITSSLEGFILIDKQGQVIQLNRAAELLFQCDTVDVAGRSLEDLLPESLAALEEKYALIADYDVARHPPRVFFDQSFCARRRDGTVFPASISFCLFEVQGQRMAYVWVIEVAHIGQAPFSPNTTPNFS